MAVLLAEGYTEFAAIVAAMLRPFRVPTRIVMAPGCAAQLPQIAALYSPKSILMVTDRGVEATGWPGRLAKTLEETNAGVITFREVEPNPRASTAEAIAELGRDAKVSLVLGIGGGSVLDAGKAAAMLIPNRGSAADYEGRDRYEEPPIPFIAVPTTCGTGSEVSWVSVLTVEARQAKISVKGETMFPAWALVDSELLRTLPGHVVAWT